MQPTPSSVPQRRLARQARQRFVEGICAGLPGLDKVVLDFLTTLMSQTGTAREMQAHRDAWMLYQQHHAGFLQRLLPALLPGFAPELPAPAASAPGMCPGHLRQGSKVLLDEQGHHADQPGNRQHRKNRRAVPLPRRQLGQQK